MKRKAFTLIELLVVVAVIGILAAMILVGLQGARARARDAERKSDLRSIKTAVETAFSDTLAVANGNAVDKATETYVADEDTVANALGWLATDNYLKTLPEDPQGDNLYMYVSDGTDYTLFGALENVNDGDIPTGSPTISGTIDTAVYNYWLQND